MIDISHAKTKIHSKCCRLQFDCHYNAISRFTVSKAVRSFTQSLIFILILRLDVDTLKLTMEKGFKSAVKGTKGKTSLLLNVDERHVDWSQQQ